MTCAIVLAAGFGSRLMPHTADRPKGLVALDGVPMLERQLFVMRSNGIREITVVGGYRVEALRYLGRPVIANPDYAQTNMVYSLMCARTLLDGSSDLIVAYSDIVYESRVLQAVLAQEGEVVIAADRQWLTLWSARMDDPLSDVETFRVDASGRLAEIGARPESLEQVEGQYIGLIKIVADVQTRLAALCDAILPARPKLQMTQLIQELIARDWDVRPAWTDGGWLEVDTLQDLERYHAMARTGELDPIYRLPRTPDIAPLLALGGGADMTPDQLEAKARRIEIRGEAATDAELASYLLAYARTGDLRYVNTVLKAQPTPGRDALLEWCEAALP